MTTLNEPVPPSLDSLVEDLSEGPWTALVMSLLACVALLLLAAGVYAGSI